MYVSIYVYIGLGVDDLVRQIYIYLQTYIKEADPLMMLELAGKNLKT